MSRTISRGLLLVVFAGCGHPTLEREYDTLVKDRDDQIKTGIEKAVGEMKEKLAEAEQRAKTAESRAKAAEEKLLASECRSETQPKESQTVRVFKDKVARFLEEAGFVSTALGFQMRRVTPMLRSRNPQNTADVEAEDGPEENDRDISETA